MANCVLSVLNKENYDDDDDDGLDGLMAEHLSFAHPALVVYLSLLFIILLKHSVVPDAFGRSVIILLLKNADGNHFIADNL